MASQQDLDAAIDGLYRGPLAAFVGARDALAATLRKDGRSADAARVKALAKPSAVAWAVNGVYWRARALYDRVLATGEQLQAVQQRGLGGAGSGDELQQAGRKRREALERAVERAAALLAEAGQRPAPALLRRVERTFEALAAGAGVEAPGRLGTELEPPGFETLLSLALPARVERPSAAPARASVRGSAAGKRDRREALDAARREERRAVAARTRAEANVSAAAARIATLEAAVTAARERLDEALRALVDARAALSAAEAASRSAVVDAEAAERAVAVAQGALEDEREG